MINYSTVEKAKEHLAEIQERLDGLVNHENLCQIAYELLGLGTTLRLEAEYNDPLNKPPPPIFHHGPMQP